MRVTTALPFAALAISIVLTACGPLRTSLPASSESPAANPGSVTLPAAAPNALLQRATITAPATSILTGSHPTQVAALPDAAAFKWVPVAAGLALPNDIEFPDDGTGRMFVVEQMGRIRIVQNGQVLPTPFLDITDRVGSGGSEQGLLGLAFHPDYKDHPYVYVNYTDLNGNTVIARFRGAGQAVDPASETDLLRVDQPFPNHNGGEMAFGPDGYLYVGLGDGGSGGDPLGNGQNTNVLLGKILRLDVDGADPYRDPPDNPFVGGGGKPEIWAYGLRNPWRFSFDRSTGDLYVADVGQDLWEEVDFAAGNPPGLNYGWSYYEGSHPYNSVAPPELKITMPVNEYSHQAGGCAIVGGYVYRGQMPEWQGIYLYGDFCSGKIWGLLRSADVSATTTWQSGLLYETGASITTFGQDTAGEVYFADRRGTVYRLQK